MAVATSTLLLAAAGLTAATSIAQGKASQDQAEANAAVYQQQAELADANKELQLFQKKRDIKRYRDAAVAQSALNSSSLSGSYLQNLNETFTNAELDIGAIEFNSALQKQNYLTQASNEKAKGNAAFTQGLVGAGASLLGGFGKSQMVNN